MPIPSSRVKFQVARGSYANLLAGITAFEEGELCYAKDQDALYIKEEGQLINLSSGLNTQLAEYIREVTGIDQTGEPMGHSDKTESSISFNSATRTFSISPASTSFTVWCKGIKNVYLEAESIQIPNSTGLYYIYFDENGSLGYQLNFFDWGTQAPTAYVYWNSATQELIYFGDERHGITLDWQTHEYLHRTRGAAIANGFDASDYTLTGSGAIDTDAQFSLAGGTFFDEDMQVDVSHSATPESNTWQQFITGPCKPAILYRSGSSWRIDTPSEFAVKFGTSYPVYNQLSAGDWTTADASVNKYIVSYVIASNNLNYPILSVIGQLQYNNVGDAEVEDFSNLDITGFPSREFRPLYKLIFQVGNYDNTIKARLRGLQDLRYVSVGNPVPATLSSEQVQDYAAQLLVNGAHSGLSYVYDDDNNAINSTASVLSVNGKTGAVSLKMEEASDAALTTSDISQGSWTATGTSNPPAISQFSQSGNTLIFHSNPVDIASQLLPGDIVLLNTIVATVENTTSVPAEDYWTLTVSGVTLPVYLASETLQLFKRITNPVADKDTWIYNGTLDKWEPIQSLQDQDVRTIASDLFVHGHHTGITFTYDAPNNHIDATVLAQNIESIDDLGDVDTSTTPPSNGQVLTWSSVDSQWKPAPGGGGGGVSAFKDLSDVTISDAANNSVYSLDPLPAYTGGRVVWQPNSSSVYNFAGLSSWDNGNISLVGGASATARSTITLASDESVYFHPDPTTNGVVPTNHTIEIEVNGASGQRMMYRTAPTLGGGTGDLVIPTMGQVRSELSVLSVNDLADVTYSSGSLNITALDQIPFTSGDVPGTETWKIYANPTYGTALGAYLTADSNDGTFVYAHRTKGLSLRSANAPIRLSGSSATTGNTPELRWETGNSALETPTGNYFGLKLPAGYSVDQTYDLPLIDGNAGDVLQTDGNGVLSFGPVSGGGGATSIDDLTDVDTATATPITGQFLEWDGTNWVPGDAPGDAVDSVNGETGVVSLGVVDMNDYSPRYVSANPAWLMSTTFVATTDFTGNGQGFLTGGGTVYVYLRKVDADGINRTSQLMGLQIGDNLTFSWNGGANTNVKQVFGETPVESTNHVRIRVNNSTESWSNNQRVEISGGTLSAVPTEIPKATGDLLTWNSVTSKFEPTPKQLATVAETGAYSDLSGTPTLVENIDDLTDVDTTTSAPTTGQVLEWDGTNWVPATPSGGADRATLADILSYTYGTAANSGEWQHWTNFGANDLYINPVDVNGIDATWIFDRVAGKVTTIYHSADNGATWTARKGTFAKGSGVSFYVFDSASGEPFFNGAQLFSFVDPRTPGKISSNADVDTVTTAPTDGQVLTWNSASSQWEPANPPGGGSTSMTRTSASATVSVAAGATNVSSISLSKSCIVYKITVDKACWLRLYNSSASASSDSTRLRTEDPVASSGVICEIIATGSSSYVLTPTPTAINAESPTSASYSLRVTNDDISTDVQVTIEYLILEE